MQSAVQWGHFLLSLFNFWTYIEDNNYFPLLFQLPVQEPPCGHATATLSTASHPVPSHTMVELGATVTVTAGPMRLSSSSRHAAWTTFMTWRPDKGGGADRGTDTAAETPTPPAEIQRVKREKWEFPLQFESVFSSDMLLSWKDFVWFHVLLLGWDHCAAAVALHAKDALRVAATVRVSPAHLVLHHCWGRLLHRLHGTSHLPRRSYCRRIAQMHLYCFTTVLHWPCLSSFFRLLPTRLCWKIITEEFRWAVGAWSYMLWLLLHAQVTHKPICWHSGTHAATH